MAARSVRGLGATHGATHASAVTELPNASGRVQVAVRVRPLSAAEHADGQLSCIAIDESGRALTIELVQDARLFSFAYDRVFVETTSQREVFDSFAAPLVDDVLAGKNATIMAYGQTGTGKTFTLSELSLGLEGIVPRAVHRIFERLSRSTGGATGASVRVTVSLLQIYLDRKSVV